MDWTSLLYRTGVLILLPVLWTVDPSRVYVLGGVVDESVDKVTDILRSYGML